MPKDAEGVYEPGQTLTEEEKGEILKDVARQKAERKAVADKVKNAKTSAELGITRKAPAAGSTSKSAAASKPAGIEGMLTAAKKPAAAAAKGAAAKGVGAKSAAGAKPSTGAKPAKPTGSKLAAAKKGGKPAGIEGMITAAKKPVLSPEEQAAAEAAEAEAAAAAAAEAHERRLEADAAADAERERRWAESEAQRQEIQNQIVEEERRVRKREEERCKRLQLSPNSHPTLALTLTLTLTRTSPNSNPRPRLHLHPHPTLTLALSRSDARSSPPRRRSRRVTPPCTPSYTTRFVCPLHALFQPLTPLAPPRRRGCSRPPSTTSRRMCSR